MVILRSYHNISRMHWSWENEYNSQKTHEVLNTQHCCSDLSPTYLTTWFVHQKTYKEKTPDQLALGFQFRLLLMIDMIFLNCHSSLCPFVKLEFLHIHSLRPGSTLYFSFCHPCLYCSILSLKLKSLPPAAATSFHPSSKCVIFWVSVDFFTFQDYMKQSCGLFDPLQLLLFFLRNQVKPPEICPLGQRTDRCLL